MFIFLFPYYFFLRISKKSVEEKNVYLVEVVLAHVAWRRHSCYMNSGYSSISSDMEIIQWLRI